MLMLKKKKHFVDQNTVRKKVLNRFVFEYILKCNLFLWW